MAKLEYHNSLNDPHPHTHIAIISERENFEETHLGDFIFQSLVFIL